MQLYVSEDNPTVLRPRKELKAFRKVKLEAGKKMIVELAIDKNDLAYWDVETHDWKVNEGKYTFHWVLLPLTFIVLVHWKSNKFK